MDARNEKEHKKWEPPLSLQLDTLSVEKTRRSGMPPKNTKQCIDRVAMRNINGVLPCLVPCPGGRVKIPPQKVQSLKQAIMSVVVRQSWPVFLCLRLPFPENCAKMVMEGANVAVFFFTFSLSLFLSLSLSFSLSLSLSLSLSFSLSLSRSLAMDQQRPSVTSKMEQRSIRSIDMLLLYHWVFSPLMQQRNPQFSD
jgi:hypothetical protein